MIKILYKIFQRVVLAFIIIYGFDLIMKGFNITIPMNIFTLSTVSLLGIPGMLMLALSFFFLL